LDIFYIHQMRLSPPLSTPMAPNKNAGTHFNINPEAAECRMRVAGNGVTPRIMDTETNINPTLPEGRMKDLLSVSAVAFMGLRCTFRRG